MPARALAPSDADGWARCGGCESAARRAPPVHLAAAAAADPSASLVPCSCTRGIDSAIRMAMLLLLLLLPLRASMVHSAGEAASGLGDRLVCSSAECSLGSRRCCWSRVGASDRCCSRSLLLPPLSVCSVYFKKLLVGDGQAETVQTEAKAKGKREKQRAVPVQPTTRTRRTSQTRWKGRRRAEQKEALEYEQTCSNAWAFERTLTVRFLWLHGLSKCTSFQFQFVFLFPFFLFISDLHSSHPPSCRSNPLPAPPLRSSLSSCRS